MHTQRTTTSILYSLNRDHLAAEPIIALARIRLTLLDRLSERLSTWSPAPVSAALFGSGARGEMKVDSDLDLLLVRPAVVDPDGGSWADQSRNLNADATTWTGNDLHILEFAEDSVVLRGWTEPVLASVLTEGLTLYGPTDRLRTQLRKGSGRGTRQSLHT